MMARRKVKTPTYTLQLRCDADALRLIYRSGEEVGLQILPGLTHEYVLFHLEGRFSQDGIRMPYRKIDRRASRDFSMSDYATWHGADKPLRMFAMQLFRARFVGYRPEWEQDKGYCMLLNGEPVNLLAIGRFSCRFSWHRNEERYYCTVTLHGESVEIACPERAPELPEAFKEGLTELTRVLTEALPPLKPQQLKLFGDVPQNAQE